MSRFFINRPNFAWVIAIFIALIGVLAIPNMAVEKFPQVAPPQLQLMITYPGASAQTINDTVVSLIEEELNGANNLLYYESSSNATGAAQITVTFKPGTDPDMAQVDVQNRLKKAEARLPQAVKDQGVTVEQASSGFFMIYGVRYKKGHENRDPQKLADFLATTVNDEIRRVDGVGKLQFFAAKSAMRVWVNPQQLLSYGLSMVDVTNAIKSQNVQVAAGSFGSRPAVDQEFTAPFIVRGMLNSPEEFGRILLKANQDGSSVHLADVARLEIGPESYSIVSSMDGLPVAAAAVQLSPGANALGTVEGVKSKLKELSIVLPANMEFVVPLDTSKFVTVAIEKVIHTLLEAIVLVFIVIFLFLQNIRYTIIPTLVVPVCILGTFGVMAFLGFSVNMMTMFGMVLAIGILVDDAIVVVENVERIMEETGLSPKEATIKAMKQISGAIIGITAVLSAVFLPLAFMSGSVGIIYRQFAVSIAVSILFSGFLALTMTPALCATILKPTAKGAREHKKGFFNWFNNRFNKLENNYQRVTTSVTGHTWRYMVIYVGLVFILGYSYIKLPVSFVPEEDQGNFVVSVQLPAGATYLRTDSLIQKVQNYFETVPAVKGAMSVIGFSFSGEGENAAMLTPTMKDWSVRGEGESVQDVVRKLNASFSDTTDGSVFAVAPAPIDGLGETGGFAFRLQNKGKLTREKFNELAAIFIHKVKESPAIAYAMIDGMPDGPQLVIDIDREKAEALGVNFNSINDVISAYYGSSMVADYVSAGRLQRVVVQADGKSRKSPDELARVYVPNATGRQVPLMSLVNLKWKVGPAQLVRYNGYNALKITGGAAPGYSSGEVMAELERIVATLPGAVGYEWTGLSYQEKAAGAQAPILFSLALAVVFLLLVALYESWFIPLSVMLIVPLGALGAVVASLGLSMSNDVFFKVGLITIIGLAAKNAVLIVEVAKSYYEAGDSPQEAVIKSARLRFRPIIMTSFAFILGVVPLAVAHGAGAASQRALGVGVIGGMLSATTLGILLTPVFFVWVLSFKRKKNVPDQKK